MRCKECGFPDLEYRWSRLAALASKLNRGSHSIGAEILEFMREIERADGYVGPLGFTPPRDREDGAAEPSPEPHNYVRGTNVNTTSSDGIEYAEPEASGGTEAITGILGWIPNWKGVSGDPDSFTVEVGDECPGRAVTWQKVLVTMLDDSIPQCDACGESHWYNFYVPDDVWEQIAPLAYVPGGGGTLCVRCIDKRCAELGIKTAGRFHFVGEGLATPPEGEAMAWDKLKQLAHRVLTQGHTDREVQQGMADDLANAVLRTHPTVEPAEGESYVELEADDLRSLVGRLRKALWPGDEDHDPEVVTPPDAHAVVAEAIRRVSAKPKLEPSVEEAWVDLDRAMCRDDRFKSQGIREAFSRLATLMKKASVFAPASPEGEESEEIDPLAPISELLTEEARRRVWTDSLTEPREPGDNER